MRVFKSPAKSITSTTLEGQPEAETWPCNQPPGRLLLLIALLIFFGELADMFLLRHLPPMPWFALTILDAATLLILLSPTYFLLYRPLKTHYFKRYRAEQEVAFLSRHILRAVEEEKKRFAHELHDECGQVLTAMQFGIETLKHSLADVPPSTIQQCDRLASMTAQLAEEVRSLTAKLRPAMLENCGLAPTLRWYIDQVAEGRPAMHIDLELVGCEARFLPETEIAVYRLCQEGLNNIFRHAQASRTRIVLSCGERLLFRIEDNGIGFDLQRTPGNVSVSQGFGLLGMRARVADLGGRLTIRSAPGEGTVIEAELPATSEGGNR